MADQNTNANNTTSLKAWTEEELRLIDRNDMDDDVFADRFFEQLESSPAIISREQVEMIEERIKKDAFRRATLIFATMPGSELCEKIKENREFAVAIAHVLDGLKESKILYQQLTDLLHNVDIRLTSALCIREDMEEVLTEGAE